MRKIDGMESRKLAIDSLEALIEAASGNPAAALEKLSGKTDAESIKRRIGILIDQGRIDDALLDICSHENSSAWIDLATYVFSALGKTAEAKASLIWARDNASVALFKRCGIRLYDGSMQWIFRDRENGQLISPGSLTKEEQQNYQSLIDFLLENYAGLLKSGKSESSLDVDILSKILDGVYILGDAEKSSLIANILQNRNPIPIRAAYAVLQGIIEPPPDISKRLWCEHGESFDHRHASCAILALTPEFKKEAMSKAQEIVDLANTPEDKHKLSQLLYGLSANADQSDRNRLVHLIKNLLGNDHNFVKIISAESALEAGEAETAISILEREDLSGEPHALRILGLAYETLGNNSEALAKFQSFATAIPNTWAYWKIAELASKNNMEDIECGALEKVVSIDTGELEARRRLSNLYLQNNNSKLAIGHLEYLCLKNPHEVEIIASLSSAYILDGQRSRAAEFLEHVPPAAASNLMVVIARSQALQLIGKADQAFDTLKAARNQNWENPRFLAQYMTVGHAAGKDGESHEALEKLIELKRQGIVSEGVLKEATIEDARQIFESARTRSETISRFIQEGKCPWLMGAEMMRDASYWAWALRTQNVNWIFDDPESRTSFSIYATNGFRIFQAESQENSLDQIQCVSSGNEVVADASALITLHSLGILDIVSRYFKKIHIPANYLPVIIEDLQKLYPHQISQKRAAEEIKRLVEKKHISISKRSDCLMLDEYADIDEFDSPPYHISDLINVLHQAGRVSEAECEKARAVAHKDPISSPESSILRLGSSISAGISTITTLFNVGWTDFLCQNFRVNIDEHEYNDILQRVEAFNILEDVRDRHAKLWEYIHSNSDRFFFDPIPKSISLDSGTKIKHDFATCSYTLASECNFPLLVDDRVCQALMLNLRKSEIGAAFGSDALLAKLMDEGYLGINEVAQAFLKMIEWRYRFIVIPTKILKLLADKYRSNAPGMDLLKVALYVHDCMRDDGLFSGLEPTDPPTSIAVRLYQTWIQNIADFVMDVWLDESYDENSATKVTDWAMAEFLPSPPRMLDVRIQSSLASLTPRTVITRALIRSSGSLKMSRINLGLRKIANGLNISESEYFSIVFGALDDF